MMDAIKLFLFFVDVFFVIYLIGYSTFLFFVSCCRSIGTLRETNGRKDERNTPS